MTPVVLALNSALLHLLWQGVVVAFLLWISLAALRRSSANARYVVSCSALALLAVLPVVTACVVYTSPIAVNRAPAALAVTAIVPPIPTEFNWLAVANTWLVPLWACGVLALSVRLLWGCAKVSTLKRTGDPAEPAVLATVARLSERVGVSGPVRVLISSLTDGPSVIGALRPVILLPAATLLGLTADQLEAVLAHELAHIRRFDYLVNIAQMLIETLFFYHPVVWWISGRIRRERELCCDDIAVSCCGDPVGYARALTALERVRIATPSLALGVVALGLKDGPLMYRIQRLLGAHPREQASSRLPGLVAILLALGCFSTQTNPIRAQTPLPQPPAPPTPPALLATPPRVQAGQTVQLAQAVQPAQIVRHDSSTSGDTGLVTVEVTIDQNGEVSDARVITGPAEQRRSALLQALSMRFPAEDTSTHRWVDVPAPPAHFNPGQTLLHAVPTRAGAADFIRLLRDRIGAIRTLLADPSTTADPAQLQKSIDSYTQSLREMEKIAAGQDPLVGTTLDDIEVSNLTDAARAQLLAQLPIHLHDVLSDDSMRAAVSAAHAALPTATIYFGQTDGGQAGLVIIAPAPYSAPLQYLPRPQR